MYYGGGGLGGQYHGAKVQKNRLLCTLHHENGIIFIFSSQKPLTILHLFTIFVYFAAFFMISTVAVAVCLGGVPRSRWRCVSTGGGVPPSSSWWPVPRWCATASSTSVASFAYLQPIRTQPHPPPAPSEARGVLLIRFKKKRKKIVWIVLICPAQTKKQAGLLHQKPCTQIVQTDNKHYRIIAVSSCKSYK